MVYHFHGGSLIKKMVEKLDPKEIVSFKELLMANSIQVDAIAQGLMF